MLKVGVIGLGVGERHIAGFEGGGRARVTALCDIDPVKLAEVGERHPGRRLTTDPGVILRAPDIDVVSIASYDDAHHAQIMAALASGKHVFAEKPLCRSDGELSQIAAALASRPKLCLSSNLILRRVPRFLDLRAAIGRGEFGRIYYVEGDYNYGRLHKIVEGWRGRIPGYSVTLGGGLHLIDLILWLLDERPDEVAAYGSGLASRGTPFGGSDLTVALLHFPSGRLAKVASNFASMAPHHHNLTVYGTDATFAHALQGAVRITSRDPLAPVQRIDDPYPGVDKGDLIPSFLDAILGTGRAEVPADQVLAGMAVALAVDRALKLGRPERIHYLT